MKPILLPYLVVRAPDGQERRIEIDKERMTVGRASAKNDIALEPDPQQVVTRLAHLIIERNADGVWTVQDNSVNGTYLQRGDETQVVKSRVTLMDGDVIRIIAHFSEVGEPAYWELVFYDPQKTRAVHAPDRGMYLEVDWLSSRVYRVHGATRQEIVGLRAKEQMLIRYMDRRNSDGNYKHAPVLCTHDELIDALWGSDPTKTKRDVNHTIYEVRRKIEVDRKPTVVGNSANYGLSDVFSPIDQSIIFLEIFSDDFYKPGFIGIYHGAIFR